MQKRNTNNFHIKKSKKGTRKAFLAPLIVIILVSIVTTAVVAYFFFKNPDTRSNDKNTTPEETIHYSPATDSEKKAANNHKQEIVDKETETSNQANNGQVSSLVITDASQYNDAVEVRAYSPSIYEDGGTCTYTFTKNEHTITKTTAAHKDAKTTYCTTLSVPRSEFADSGVWNLEISLVSASGKGTANAKVTLQ